ncbi:MAG: DUF1858 domain-containing protein [Candidatus Diapherotrites archaeon]|nr:DUF1858 domain-containing protein [Candidatus Diapherotrites archaeon]
MNSSISRDMLMEEVAAQFPKAASIMAEYGLHCIGCHASSLDTVEQGALSHGMSEDEVNDMIAYINEELAKEEKK